MACIKRKAKPCRVAGGPLHVTQLTEARNGADSVFKYIMMDLSAPLRIKKPEEPDELLYTLVSVCMVSKLVKVVSIESKTKDSFLLALNVLFGEVGKPTKLFVDEEKGLISLTKDMIIEANASLMRNHGITVEIVTAHQHSAHGLVERRMAFFNDNMGAFNIGQAGISKTEAANYMRCIAARLNDKPYGLRFLNRSDTGLRGIPPDLELETITPNHWKLTHRKTSPNSVSVQLPETVQEHQSAVSINLKMIAEFFDTKLLPRLLLDIDRSRTTSDTPLSIDSIVLFWPDGNDSIRPKGSQPKLARVIELMDDSDGKQRKALLSYINASKVLMDEDHQIKSVPFKDTWRRIDQLIPVDDASHQRSVQAMLEKACCQAKSPSEQDQSSPHNVVETDAALDPIDGTPPTSLASQDTDDEDIDNDKGTDIDPSYTTVVQHGNTERRYTRATRNTAIPHCSLLIQVKQLLQQS